jgi:hypothetical protein
MKHITEFLIKQFLMRYLSDALTKNTTRVFPNEISHQLNVRRTISNIQNHIIRNSDTPINKGIIF